VAGNALGIFGVNEARAEEDDEEKEDSAAKMCESRSEGVGSDSVACPLITTRIADGDSDPTGLRLWMREHADGNGHASRASVGLDAEQRPA